MIKKILYCVIILFIFKFIAIAQHFEIMNKPLSVNRGEINKSWHFYSLGLYYKSIKEYNKAIKYFEKGIKNKIELYRINYQIARCYYHLSNYENAIHHSRLAIK